MLIKNKNFLLLLTGRLLTNIADSIYYVASMWFVYHLSGSAFYSGIAGFLTSLPWAFQFLTGPFIDRWRIKKILIVTQLLQAVLLLLIPLLYYFDILTVPIILIIMPLLSIIQQFIYPAQSKVLPIVVQKDQLLKANTSFSIAYQGIDFVFNALSGILVAVVGAITLFTIDSLLFTIAAMLFALLRLPEEENNNQSNKMRENMSTYIADLKEGFFVIFHSLLILFKIGSIIINFGIGGVMALLPAFAAERGGAELYGYYLAALSIGSLLGAFLAPKLSNIRLSTFHITSYIISPICWIAFVLVPSNSWSIFFFALIWIPIGASNVISPSIIQSSVPIRLLGRVNSVSSSISNIIMPIGSILSGYIAMQFGTINMLVALGLLFFTDALLWFLHPKLRKMPILSEINERVLEISSIEK